MCIIWGVARLNVYLPDDLAAAARRAGLNVSGLTRDAVQRALTSRSTDEWLATLRPVPAHRATHGGVLAALDADRDELATRWG